MYHCSRTDVSERIKQTEEDPVVGDLFVKFASWLQVYQAYVNNYDMFVSKLKETREKHKSFDDMIRKRLGKVACCGGLFAERSRL